MIRPQHLTPTLTVPPPRPAPEPPSPAIPTSTRALARRSVPRNIRVVLYSHDAQGLGHLRRNLALAHQLANELPALTGASVTGLLVAGVSPSPGFPLPAGFDWLVLPGFTKGGNGYRPRGLRGTPDSLATLRSGLVASTLQRFAPHLVIVDRHIYGVRKELRAPLKHLRATSPQTRIVLGLREVLDAPEVAAAEWRNLDTPANLRRLIDEVWVYGDPTVHNPVTTGEVPMCLRDRAVFTGYLAKGRSLLERGVRAPEDPFVLTTVGGGSDGLELLRSAVRMTPPTGHRHVLVTGPQLDDAGFDAVQAAAGPTTEVHRSLPGLTRWIERAAAVIAMGGYNTACEILATSTPALIVPREQPRLEQLIRARALQAVDAVDVMRTTELTPEGLTAWAAGAVTRRMPRTDLNTDGLPATARRAAALLRAQLATTHALQEIAS
ncbi:MULTISPECIES: glycosyltransferase family protein [unclassified Actinomyces]|uniref:glycosyltransferase family protein n=1 Tax=unclassified Actinomyces TaxID=2609248 RepID=UPI000D59481D|nr:MULTISPECIES: glycosyltransferase [unclassified Actinomyces]RAX22923.1 glycosyl transferase family 28 [Actinomyces sp. Z3]